MREALSCERCVSLCVASWCVSFVLFIFFFFIDVLKDLCSFVLILFFVVAFSFFFEIAKDWCSFVLIFLFFVTFIFLSLF